MKIDELIAKIKVTKSDEKRQKLRKLLFDNLAKPTKLSANQTINLLVLALEELSDNPDFAESLGIRIFRNVTVTSILSPDKTQRFIELLSLQLKDKEGDRKSYSTALLLAGGALEFFIRNLGESDRFLNKKHPDVMDKDTASSLLTALADSPYALLAIKFVEASGYNISDLGLMENIARGAIKNFKYGHGSEVLDYILKLSGGKAVFAKEFVEELLGNALKEEKSVADDILKYLKINDLIGPDLDINLAIRLVALEVDTSYSSFAYFSKLNLIANDELDVEIPYAISRIIKAIPRNLPFIAKISAKQPKIKKILQDKFREFLQISLCPEYARSGNFVTNFFAIYNQIFTGDEEGQQLLKSLDEDKVKRIYGFYKKGDVSDHEVFVSQILACADAKNIIKFLIINDAAENGIIDSIRQREGGEEIFSQEFIEATLEEFAKEDLVALRRFSQYLISHNLAKETINLDINLMISVVASSPSRITKEDLERFNNFDFTGDLDDLEFLKRNLRNLIERSPLKNMSAFAKFLSKISEKNPEIKEFIKQEFRRNLTSPSEPFLKNAELSQIFFALHDATIFSDEEKQQLLTEAASGTKESEQWRFEQTIIEIFKNYRKDGVGSVNDPALFLRNFTINAKFFLRTMPTNRIFSVVHYPLFKEIFKDPEVKAIIKEKIFNPAERITIDLSKLPNVFDLIDAAEKKELCEKMDVFEQFAIFDSIDEEEVRELARNRIKEYCDKYGLGVLLFTVHGRKLNYEAMVKSLVSLKSVLKIDINDLYLVEIIDDVKYSGSLPAFVNAVLAVNVDESATAKNKLKSPIEIGFSGGAAVSLRAVQDVVFMMQFFPEKINDDVIRLLAKDPAAISSINATIDFRNSPYVTSQARQLFAKINARISWGSKKIAVEKLFSFEDLVEIKRGFPRVNPSIVEEAAEPNEVATSNIYKLLKGGLSFQQFYQGISQEEREELKLFVMNDEERKVIKKLLLDQLEVAQAELEQISNDLKGLDRSKFQQWSSEDQEKFQKKQLLLELVEGLEELQNPPQGEKEETIISAFEALIKSKRDLPAELKAKEESIKNIQYTNSVKENWYKFRNKIAEFKELATFCKSKKELMARISSAFALIVLPHCEANMGTLLNGELESYRYANLHQAAFASALFEAALPVLNSGQDEIRSSSRYEEVIQGTRNVFLPENHFYYLLGKQVARLENERGLSSSTASSSASRQEEKFIQSGKEVYKKILVPDTSISRRGRNRVTPVAAQQQGVAVR